jgi:hypothetical protein
MSASVLPFPLSRRRHLIYRQARYAAGLGPDAAERHIGQQIKIQADAMRRRGIDESLIANEVRRLENAIRDALMRDADGGAR